jgi:ribonuclease VapC
MVIDTSALVAILEEEGQSDALRIAISEDPIRLISTVSILEATCVLGARRGPNAVLDLNLFFSALQLEPIPFDSEQVSLAQRAWLSYGRGRHPARLNFGDCASYALAQSRNEPLLFIGNDFALTDVQTVRHGSRESE